MAFLEHPDMPKNIGGIQGLNPWNVLMFSVISAWFCTRSRDGYAWDMPSYITGLLIVYCLVIVWSFIRLVNDDSMLKTLADFEDYSFASAFSEYLVNSIKWALPGILVYDACRTRKRLIIGLAVVLALYLLIGAQVVKHMPIRAVAADGATLSRLANKLLHKTVGYHRVNLSMMLSGASWAMLGALVLVKGRRNQILIIIAASTISLGQALTGGRAGYVTWGLVGMILCVVRWRQLFIYIPMVVLAVCMFLPGVRDRMLQGFGSQSGNIVKRTDQAEITSGRTIAWSYVIPKIGESPLFGYGRLAMIRTGIYQKVMDDYDEGESFPHPHNAYLEMLLDNGYLGFFLVMPFYLVVLFHSLRVLLDRSDPLFAAVGGAACSLVLALLIASMGSQTFYPREGSVGMWAAIGLILRLSVERSRSRAWGTSLFGEEETEESMEQPSETVPA